MLTFSLIRASAMACEIPTPSRGEVPRPTSSIRIKESAVVIPGIDMLSARQRNTSRRYTKNHSRRCHFISESAETLLHIIVIWKPSEEGIMYPSSGKSSVFDYRHRSTYLKLPYSAGTKHPHIAITVNSPICRKYVLFPVKECYLRLSKWWLSNLANLTYYTQWSGSSSIDMKRLILTWVLALFGKMRIHNSTRHSVRACLPNELSRGWDGGPP